MMNRTAAKRLVGGLIAVTGLVGLAGPAEAATTTVNVVDNSFNAATSKIAVGDTVKWTFNGFAGHTATDSTAMNLFNSGTKTRGSTFSYAFTGAGTYTYHCLIHFGMTGKVKI